jgi:signal peptidase II
MTEIGENHAAEILDETAEQEEIIETGELPEAGEAIAGEQEAETDGTEAEDEEAEAAAGQAKPSRVWERWLLFLVAGAIIFLDQFSKNLVETALDLYTYWAPIPELENIFRITHISNTGVAFGLFQNGNAIFTILALIVSIGIVIYNSRLDRGHKLLRLALGLQMGGALGNMIDRVRQGYVTDFMDFGPWPVWNLADLAIVSGTILLVLIMFNEERQEKKLAEETVADDDQIGPAFETTTPPIDESPTS